MDYSKLSLVEISKATEKKIPSDKKMKKKGYRLSHLEGINPRSKTYVKEGTTPQRVAGPMIGSLAGGLVGGVVDAASRGKTRGLGITAGSTIGATAALSRNVRSGDTVSYNRRSGKKAQGKVQVPGTGYFNVY